MTVVCGKFIYVCVIILDFILTLLIRNKIFEKNKTLRLDSAATLRLCATQHGLGKHYAAVIINKEINTKFPKFPRSKNPENGPHTENRLA